MASPSTSTGHKAGAQQVPASAESAQREQSAIDARQHSEASKELGKPAETTIGDASQLTQGAPGERLGGALTDEAKGPPRLGQQAINDLRELIKVAHDTGNISGLPDALAILDGT